MCLFNSAKSRVPKDFAFVTNFCASDLFINTNSNWYHRLMYWSGSYISLNSRKYFHLGSISSMTAWSDLAGMKTLELNPSHLFPTYIICSGGCMVTTWVSRRHLICKVSVATALMAHKYPPRLKAEFCSTLLIVYLLYSLTCSSSWMNRAYTHHLITLAE